MALRGLGLLPVLVAGNDLVASVVAVDAGSLAPAGDLPGPAEPRATEYVVVLKNFGRSRYERNDLVAFSSPTTRRPAVARLKHFNGEFACVMPIRGSSFGRLAAIPPGKVWLQSDGAAARHDSSDFGPVPMGLLEGKALACVWPLNRARWL
jgi:hypothetical protein